MLNPRIEKLTEITGLLREQYTELEMLVDCSGKSGEQLERIGELLRAVRQTESVLRPMREDFNLSGEELPPELAAINQETIQLLTRLMPKLTTLEKESTEAAKRLFPKIQESVRAVRMQEAYETSAARQ